MRPVGRFHARRTLPEATTENRASRRRERDVVHRLDRVPMAVVAERLSAILDRSGLLLSVDARRTMGSNQLSSGHGSAGEGRARRKSDGRRDR